MREKYCNNCERVLAINEKLERELADARAKCSRLDKRTGEDDKLIENLGAENAALKDAVNEDNIKLKFKCEGLERDNRDIHAAEVCQRTMALNLRIQVDKLEAELARLTGELNHLKACSRHDLKKSVFVEHLLPEFGPSKSVNLTTEKLRDFNAHYTELAVFISEMLGVEYSKLCMADMMFRRTMTDRWRLMAGKLAEALKALDGDLVNYNTDSIGVDEALAEYEGMLKT